MKRVAVIGGGIFGCTAAIYAARAGHEVHLFEKEKDLLQSASGINQYRLHRGYHYPRSPETAFSALHAETTFREEYGGSVIDGGRHLYGIAREGSLVSAKQFLDFCDAQELAYKKVDVPELVDRAKVELVIEGVEARFDPDILRTLAKQKLEESGVTVHLGVSADASLSDSFDKIVIAAYANTNEVLGLFSETSSEYQFEICEKPVVSLPASFGMTDLVILDGPFMCVDPLGKSGLYVLGNVVHAIHATNVGQKPEIPERLRPLLNAGIVKDPPVSNYGKFIEAGVPYIPLLKKAKHVGSLYTIRTVLPRVEKTDARPTLVTPVDEKCIQIFSGKIGNCVEAAIRATSLL
ncbi:MAG: FAD-dependent oxidoreductase [Candidatus Paceibacterota bacterium]